MKLQKYFCQVRTSYLPNEILWGYRFEHSCVAYDQKVAKYVVSVNNLNRVIADNMTPRWAFHYLLNKVYSSRGCQVPTFPLKNVPVLPQIWAFQGEIKTNFKFDIVTVGAQRRTTTRDGYQGSQCRAHQGQGRLATPWRRAKRARRWGSRADISILFFQIFLHFSSNKFCIFPPNISKYYPIFSIRRRSVGSTDPNQRCPPINYNYLTNISILVLQIFLYFSSEYFYTLLQNISLLFFQIFLYNL